MNNSEKKGIRKYLNLFDITVILIVVVLIAVLLGSKYIKWGSQKSAGENKENGASEGETGKTEIPPDTVRYTIELTGLQKGTADDIEAGDTLIDRVKKYEIGKVVDIEIMSTVRQYTDYVNGVVSEVKALYTETAVITLEANCSETDTQITVGGGYVVRIGNSVSVKCRGFMGTGYIIGIERSGD